MAEPQARTLSLSDHSRDPQSSPRLTHHGRSTGASAVKNTRVVENVQKRLDEKRAQEGHRNSNKDSRKAVIERLKRRNDLRTKVNQKLKMRRPEDEEDRYVDEFVDDIVRDGNEFDVEPFPSPRGGIAEAAMRHLKRPMIRVFGPDDYEPVPQKVDEQLTRSTQNSKYSIMQRRASFFDPTDTRDDWAGWLLDNLWFQMLMGALIAMNGIVLGMEADHPEYPYWDVIEQSLLMVFCVELILRLYSLGPVNYFDVSRQDFQWDMFDLVVVSIGVLDFLSECVAVWMDGTWIRKKGSQGNFTTLLRMVRLLRILRILRIVRFLSRLYTLAMGFALAVMAVVRVAVLMAVVLYICSVVLVRTVGHLPREHAQSAWLAHRFGSIGTAMLTLFELVMNPDLREYHEIFENFPFLAIFLMVFVVFGSFGMIALLTGVISESTFSRNIARVEEERVEREMIREEILRTCGEIFDDIPQDENGEVLPEDLLPILPRLKEIFNELEISYISSDLDTCMDVMDTDVSGGINRSEFSRGILQVAEGGPLLMMQLHYEAVRQTERKIHIEMRSMQRWFEQNLERILHGGTPAMTPALSPSPSQEGFSQLLEVPDASKLQVPKLNKSHSADIVNSPSPRKSVESLRGVVRDALQEVMGSLATLSPNDVTNDGAKLVPAASGKDVVAPVYVNLLQGNISSLARDIQNLEGLVFSFSSRFEDLLMGIAAKCSAGQTAELNTMRRLLDHQSGVGNSSGRHAALAVETHALVARLVAATESKEPR